MQMAECHRYLRCKESCLLFSKALDLYKVTKEFSSPYEVHKKVNSNFILEYVLHSHQEGMFDRVQDIFLKLNVFHLLVLDYDIFPNALHCELSSSPRLLHQVYFTEGALADHLFDLEVFQLGGS